MIKFFLCSLLFSNLLWANVIDKGTDVVTKLEEFPKPTVSENSISFPGDIRIRLQPPDGTEFTRDRNYYDSKIFQVFLNKGSYISGSSPLAKGGEDGVINIEIKDTPAKMDKSAVWVGDVIIKLEPEEDHDGKHIITITKLRITKSEKSSTSIFTDEQPQVTLSFGISENGRDSEKLTSITVKNTIAYPEQSSTVIEVEDLSYAGRVRWENPEITYFADTEGKIKTSNSVLVMAIRNEGDSEDDINVKYFPKTKEGAVPDLNPTLTAAKCKFDPVGRKINCDINDDEYWWFVDSVQDESSTFKMVVVPADKSEAVVGGLLSGFSYSVILQYKRGLSRTDSATITPVETIALGEKHELGDPRCFVVSAAFGSSFAKHIDIFRWFRDEFLLTNSLGEDLVNYYYKTSPPFADYVAESSALKTILRTVLFPLAGVLYLLQFALSYYWIVLLLALAYFSRKFFVRFS